MPDSDTVSAGQRPVFSSLLDKVVAEKSAEGSGNGLPRDLAHELALLFGQAQPKWTFRDIPLNADTGQKAALLSLLPRKRLLASLSGLFGIVMVAPGLRKRLQAGLSHEFAEFRQVTTDFRFTVGDLAILTVRGYACLVEIVRGVTDWQEAAIRAGAAGDNPEAYAVQVSPHHGDAFEAERRFGKGEFYASAGLARCAAASADFTAPGRLDLDRQMTLERGWDALLVPNRGAMFLSAKILAEPDRTVFRAGDIVVNCNGELILVTSVSFRSHLRWHGINVSLGTVPLRSGQIGFSFRHRVEFRPDSVRHANAAECAMFLGMLAASSSGGSNANP